MLQLRAVVGHHNLDEEKEGFGALVVFILQYTGSGLDVALFRVCAMSARDQKSSWRLTYQVRFAAAGEIVAGPSCLR